MIKIPQLTILLFSFFLWSNFVSAETNHPSSPPFEVLQIYPYISVSKIQLSEAKTLYDLKNDQNRLNLEYQPAWVEKYISVEIQVCQQGEIKKAISTNEVLTSEQKKLLLNADPGKDINVEISYWPKNNLKQNEPKEINFSFMVNPENSATFPGGTAALNEYLSSSSIHTIRADLFVEYDMTAIKFVVTAEGKVQQAEIFGEAYQAGKFAFINQALLETIRKMPSWQPASFEDGTKIDQAFVLTVGSKENCLMPLLNIGRD